jgi:hypothetical protein
MVQPKYNPQEALERVKLMMNYDLSKTSTENKKVIEEQTQKSSDPFACVKNYYTSKNIKFEEYTYSSGAWSGVQEISLNFPEKIQWFFQSGHAEYGNLWKEKKDGTIEDYNKGWGAWECDGKSNFIIKTDDGTIYKSTQPNRTQTTQPTQKVQPAAQPVQTQPKADKKQDTPDPSRPQKLKPKDSPLGTTLKDTSIPKRSCVVYVNQLFEAWERSRGQKFDTNQINELRGYAQRCMDDHFPSGSKQGNWGITGLGGGKTDQKLLQLSACKSPAPSQSGPDSIFRLARKC